MRIGTIFHPVMFFALANSARVLEDTTRRTFDPRLLIISMSITPAMPDDPDPPCPVPVG
ncbi:hypothetical protein [Bradyrhizobium sp. SEMIA]|uniref:hypothetical protein n=1 Tax=Bradyrhizobium sp. SEMIA TaxID=2597515 RepID=UPI0018A578BD|nr:hypothetical protein [Bradyrhizobium sp. SEMIA]QOG21728.1 hypothetical protein FOM02_34980 [Bradyrhizobium sp. SEMIA]